MLGAIIQALKSIVDLRKTARQDKKTGLEIQKLQREISSKESLIQPASLEDVQKYDAKVDTLCRTVQKQRMLSGFPFVRLLCFFAFVIISSFIFVRLIRYVIAMVVEKK
jgi:hypothetical protein